MSPRAAWRLESLGFARVYEYGAGKVDWLAAGLPTEGDEPSPQRIGSLARPDVPTCGLGERVRDVADRVRAAGWDVCYVVTDTRVLLGRLTSKELNARADATAEQVMRPGPSTYRAHVPANDLAELMWQRGIDVLPVTTGEGRLIGAVRRQDLGRPHEHHHEHADGDAGAP